VSECEVFDKLDVVGELFGGIFEYGDGFVEIFISRDELGVLDRVFNFVLFVGVIFFSI